MKSEGSQVFTLPMGTNQLVAYRHLADPDQDFSQLLVATLNWLRAGQKGVQICAMTGTTGMGMPDLGKLDLFREKFCKALDEAAIMGESFLTEWRGSAFNVGGAYGRYLVVTLSSIR